MPTAVITTAARSRWSCGAAALGLVGGAPGAGLVAGLTEQRRQRRVRSPRHPGARDRPPQCVAGARDVAAGLVHAAEHAPRRRRSADPPRPRRRGRAAARAKSPCWRYRLPSARCAFGPRVDVGGSPRRGDGLVDPIDALQQQRQVVVGEGVLGAPGDDLPERPDRGLDVLFGLRQAEREQALGVVRPGGRPGLGASDGVRARAPPCPGRRPDCSWRGLKSGRLRRARAGRRRPRRPGRQSARAPRRGGSGCRRRRAPRRPPPRAARARPGWLPSASRATARS